MQEFFASEKLWVIDRETGVKVGHMRVSED